MKKITSKFKGGFIVIDDDPINNFLCETMLVNSFPKSPVKIFEDPVIAVEHLQTQPVDKAIDNTIILLDINMPTLNGWAVLKKFANLPDEIKQHYKIFLLTSSISIKDKERAGMDPYVLGFLEKPLSDEHMEEVIKILSV